jgi:hypothetical protein
MIGIVLCKTAILAMVTVCDINHSGAKNNKLRNAEDGDTAS